MDFIPPYVLQHIETAPAQAKKSNKVNFKALATAHQIGDVIEPVEPKYFTSPDATQPQADTRTGWFARLRF